MKILRKLTILLLALALVVMIVPPVGVRADTGTVVIFHTNDIHGRAEGDSATTQDQEGKDVPRLEGIIGYARYKEIIDEEKAALTDSQVLVLDCGDAVHGTNFATLNKGESIIELMNMVGVDAMACGNHEFNYGPVRLKDLEGMAAAAFPLMAANIKKTDSSTFFNVNSKIFDVTPSVRVGVFGLATPETKVKSAPKHTEGLDFGAGPNDVDLDAFALVTQAEIDALKAAGANFVVALGHLGVDTESAIRSDLLIPKLSDLDLFVDGHSHTAFEEGKAVKDKDGFEVLLVQTGAHFANIGKVTLNFDGGILKSKKAELIKFADVSSRDGDTAILAKVKAFNDDNEVILGEKIGETAVELDGERNNVRAGETNLSSLVANSLLKGSGADVALTNGGNVRRSIPVGPITMGVALEVLPFENTVIVLKVTGQDIIDALTHGSSAYPGTAGGFPNVAGMSFVIVTQGEGEEETFVRVEDVKVAGKPIDPKATYTLVTNDFLADGGDGYTMFKGAEQVTLLGLMLDLFVDEIQALSKDGPFSYEAAGNLTFKNLPFEEEVPTGESMTYLLAGSLFMILSALVLVSRKKAFKA